MPSRWHLNGFLTSWRSAVDKRFPQRGKASDGTIGDLRHQEESFSEHNPDADGSVDAWDMDVNVLGSHTESGTPNELALIERLKADFQKQAGAQLWIHAGKIANRDVGNWRRRNYVGANKHHKHVHWQSRPAKENTPVSTSAVARRMAPTDDVVETAGTPAPRWPGKEYRRDEGMKPDRNVQKWQARMIARGWRSLGTADGVFGPKTESVVRRYQAVCKVPVDGVIGRVTWPLPWTRPFGDQ